VDGERLLSVDEFAAIEQQMQLLEQLMVASDGAAIERQTKRLTQVTDAFAERRLDTTVKAGLAGRRVNEIEE
jgi:molecular chaperone HscA